MLAFLKIHDFCYNLLKCISVFFQMEKDFGCRIIGYCNTVTEGLTSVYRLYKYFYYINWSVVKVTYRLGPQQILVLLSFENYVALASFIPRFPVWRTCLVLQNDWDESRKRSDYLKIPFLCFSNCICSIFLWLEWPQEIFFKLIWIILLQMLS